MALKEYLNAGHRVRPASDKPIICRACNGKMIRTPRLLEKGADGPIQKLPGRYQVIVCGRCGWIWWLA